MQDTKKKIVFVGATSSIAEHCARLLVSDKYLSQSAEIILAGRNQKKLDAFASDLMIRSSHINVQTKVLNFIDTEEIFSFVENCYLKQPVDIVLIAHGILPDQVECQKNLQLCQKTLEINSISPVLFAEAFAGHMEKIGRGTLVIIGSVAGDRGRKSNYVYGAAKGLIACYVQGLQHRLAHTAVKVILIKPGPTATPMTAHLQKKGMRLASVESVAQRIVHALGRRQETVYAPAYWKIIMQIIRHIPNSFFKKLNI